MGNISVAEIDYQSCHGVWLITCYCEKLTGYVHNRKFKNLPFYIVALFARALADLNVKDLVTNIGSASAAPAAGAAPAAKGAPAG